MKKASKALLGLLSLSLVVALTAGTGMAMFFANITEPDHVLQHSDSPKKFDAFGYDVAISGDTIVVGAPGDDTVGTDDGSAYVFEHNGGAWSETRLDNPDAAAGDQFGNAVAIDGDTIVVGAFADGAGNDNNFGIAYVFEPVSGVWTLKRKLTVAGLPSTARLGYKVAVSGDRIAVGAIGTATVYIFERDAGGDGGWSNAPTKEIPTPSGGINSSFGWDISMSGDLLLVGAFGNGAAYLYDGGINFALVKTITGPTSEAFAWAVAISGDTAIVGAIGADTGSTLNHGAAYVFQRDQGGANNWGQVAKLVASEVPNAGTTNDQLGVSVAISGDTAVFGAFADDIYGHDSGSAYVFMRDGGGNWVETNKLIQNASGFGAGVEEHWFGASVATTPSRAVVGAPMFRFNPHPPLPGHAYVYELEGGGGGGGDPAPALLTAPTDFVATVVGSSQVDLTWVDTSSVENAFKVQRQPSGGSWTTVVWADADQTSYSDTGLSAGDWCYRIRAHGPDGFTAYVNSMPACVTVGGGGSSPPSGVPAAPSNLLGSAVSSSRIDLTWDDNSNNENAFKLQRQPSGGSWTTVVWADANQTSYSDTGLSSGTWCYRIRSHSPDGFSAYVESPCVTLDGGGGSTPPPSSDAPNPPDQFTAISPAGSNRVDLSWTDNSTDEHSFKLQWAPAGSDSWTTIWISKNETSFSHQGLDPDGWYCYRIRSHNLSGHSNFVLSNPICLPVGSGGSAAALAAGPRAPSDFVVTSPAAGIVDLAWNDNATGENDYKLQWQEPNGEWTTIWLLANAEGFTYGVPGGIYCYRLRAQNGDLSNYVLSSPICLTVDDP